VEAVGMKGVERVIKKEQKSRDVGRHQVKIDSDEGTERSAGIRWENGGGPA